MPAISIKESKQPDLIERFVGADARIVNRESVAVNSYIAAEWLEVAMPGETQPEDNGMLYLFPIDDNKFCLQLCYLQYGDSAEANASVCSVQFLPPFFEQYPAEMLMANQPFRFDESTEQQFPVCAQTRVLLGQLGQSATLTPFIRSLQLSETAMHLLRRALECITIPFAVCQVPACRFLAYESEREKIQDAINMVQQSIDQPFTIKELARRVAMNECYLKKGFKTVTGKTIHEYQQELRINKAKELLQQQGRSVTDVANTLGYSSISHFSTAFKRVTGMKPCELLA
ncbi:MAG: AraC family transcriptional regulator [Bacteroidota bacterium]